MSNKYRTVIEASSPWKPFDFKEIFRYRDMFYFKILNGYKAQQRQTIFSYLWVIVDPAVRILFFTIIFNKIAKVDTGDVPYIIFNAAAMAGWTFFYSGMDGAVHSLKSESNLLQKVYFPRIFIPLIPSIIHFPNFCIQLFFTFLLLIYYGYSPDASVFSIIPILLIMVIYSCAIGLLLTTLMIQFKDLGKIWSYFLQALTYSVPLAYPMNLFPENLQKILAYHPIIPLIQGFRSAMLGAKGSVIPWTDIGVSFLFSLILLYIGAVIFRLREPNIVDAI